jgi:tetratricopeptide (TPR) repeat protein
MMVRACRQSQDKSAQEELLHHSEQLLRQALLEHPRDSILLFNLATCHMNRYGCCSHTEDLEQSISLFRELISVNALYPDIHFCLGTALGYKGESAAAISSLKKQIALDPYHIGAHFSLGQELAKGGADTVEEAVACYKTALEIHEQVPPDLMHANMAFFKQNKAAYNRCKEVVKLERRARKEFYAHEQGEAHWGDIGRNLVAKNYISALAKATAYVEAHPKQALAHTCLGTVLRRMEHFSAATDSLKRAISLDPEAFEAFNNLGLVCTSIKDNDGAIVAFKRACLLDPKHASCHYNLGTALETKGLLHGALASYRSALHAEGTHANQIKSVPVVARHAIKQCLEKIAIRDETKWVCANPSCLTPSRTNPKMLCGRCQKASYCCSTCQRAHWKLHRSTCQSPCVTIFKANIISEGLKEEKERSVYVCANPICAKPDSALQCKRCLSASYCCGECQKVHWKQHRSSCLPRKDTQLHIETAKQQLRTFAARAESVGDSLAPPEHLEWAIGKVAAGYSCKPNQKSESGVECKPVKELPSAVLALKDKGNSYMLTKDHKQAVLMYTKAITLLENEGMRNAKLHTNRAAAYLCFQPPEYGGAAIDGQLAIETDSGWWKGYWYRGQGICGLVMPDPDHARQVSEAIYAFESCMQCASLPASKRNDVVQHIESELNRLRHRPTPR